MDHVQFATSFGFVVLSVCSEAMFVAHRTRSASSRCAAAQAQTSLKFSKRLAKVCAGAIRGPYWRLHSLAPAWRAPVHLRTLYLAALQLLRRSGVLARCALAHSTSKPSFVAAARRRPPTRLTAGRLSLLAPLC